VSLLISKPRSVSVVAEVLARASLPVTVQFAHIAFLSIWLFTCMATGSEISPNVKDAQNRMICGPRCVDCVMRWFDRTDQELIDLVREIQWPDLASGASLEKLQVALQRRGIETKLVDINPPSVFEWSYPAIVHLSNPRPNGHFIVRLPGSKNGQERIWDGLAGETAISKGKLCAQMSGAVLLTAPKPIGDIDSMSLHIEPRLSFFPARILLIAFVIGSLYVLWCDRIPKTWNRHSRMTNEITSG
jgi:ABC-type bacteriocin/lantibiotic exporter with double-glycine peptidase domain